MTSVALTPLVGMFLSRIGDSLAGKTAAPPLEQLLGPLLEPLKAKFGDLSVMKLKPEIVSAALTAMKLPVPSEVVGPLISLMQDGNDTSLREWLESPENLKRAANILLKRRDDEMLITRCPYCNMLHSA